MRRGANAAFDQTATIKLHAECSSHAGGPLQLHQPPALDQFQR